IRREKIKVLHAHSSSLLVANMVSLAVPSLHLVWHDHFGRFTMEKRPEWLFRLLPPRVSGVFAGSAPPARWSKVRLRVAPDRVWYVPNFACEANNQHILDDLPGSRGRRIVCVANLRPEKDHITLIRAMKRVVDVFPDAHLLVVGGTENQEHFQ